MENNLANKVLSTSSTFYEFLFLFFSFESFTMNSFSSSVWTRSSSFIRLRRRLAIFFPKKILVPTNLLRTSSTIVRHVISAPSLNPHSCICCNKSCFVVQFRHVFLKSSNFITFITQFKNGIKTYNLSLASWHRNDLFPTLIFISLNLH